MIRQRATHTRWKTAVVTPMSVVLLALAPIGCGGAHTRQDRQQPSRHVDGQSGQPPTPGPVAQTHRAQSVALTDTPPTLSAVCVKNKLLHAICPRRVPATDAPSTAVRALGFCVDHTGRDLVIGGHYARLASGRCVDAGWGYEAVARLPGAPTGVAVTVRGFDPVTRVLSPAEAGLIPPPAHVHVEIQASLRPTDIAASWPRVREPVSDSLLNARRKQPVSLGWVRWYGIRGQLVLEPVYPYGGEWGGHLVFRFAARHVNYALTLHAWMPATRETARGVNRVINVQRPPALPSVIATLKAILRSAPISTQNAP